MKVQQVKSTPEKSMQDFGNIPVSFCVSQYLRL
jgi:hypothetical protein